MAFAGKLMSIASPDNRAKFIEGFKTDFNVGREDTQEISNEARKRKGLPKEMPQIQSYGANHPTLYRAREAIGLPVDKDYAAVREERGLGLSNDTVTKYGQLAGTIARDVVEDGSRALWWLLNAPQAAVQVLGDLGIQGANMKKFYDPNNPYNPNLLQGKHIYRDKDGRTLDSGETNKIIEAGLGRLVPDTDKARKGEMKLQLRGGATYVNDPERPGKKTVAVSNNSAVAQKLPLLGAGIGVNTAVGLMNPFGGAEGYKAISPSEEDPSQTDNVLFEVANKYILGRTGGLLPYDEFSKVRPDVSPEEYKRYKAYKGSRQGDINPFDGDFAIPYVIKGTDDGIHGAELDFLGRSIPVNTGVIPIASSIAGAALGGIQPGGSRLSTLAKSTLGGLTGLTAGNMAGGLLEAERRRRNEIENQQQIY